MKTAQIQLAQGDMLLQLHPGINVQPLGESPALLTVRNSDAPVYLDDEAVALKIMGNLRIATVNLTNQPGIHRLRLGNGPTSTAFDFATSTAKASWLEIEEMIAATRLFAIDRGRAFLYGGQAGRIDLTQTEKMFFWLRDRLNELAAHVTAIDKAPASRPQTRLRSSTRVAGLDRRATASLLRERKSLLEPADDGGITISGERYWPNAVKVRLRYNALPAPEHQRIKHLLQSISRACTDLSLIRGEVGPYTTTINRLLALRLLSTLPIQSEPKMMPFPSEIERRDLRYGRIRQLADELRREVAVGHLSDGIRAGVKDAWEVYQCFAAHIVGAALDLSYISRNADLRERNKSGASMVGEGLVLYYDVQPPPDLLQSWRSTTNRPASERPDIVILDLKRHRCILLDVKFSADARGRCRSEHVFEMQGYLNSYGIQRGGVVFPGRRSASALIEGNRHCIGEIPLTAAEAQLDFPVFLADIRQQLESLWSDLP